MEFNNTTGSIHIEFHAGGVRSAQRPFRSFMSTGLDRINKADGTTSSWWMRSIAVEGRAGPRGMSMPAELFLKTLSSIHRDGQNGSIHLTRRGMRH